MIKNRHCVWGALILATAGSVRAEEKELPLEVATQNYAHTRLLQEGTVKVPGCDLHYHTLSLAAIRGQAGSKKFDAMEV